MDIEQRIQNATRIGNIFGKIGSGVNVTDHVFIIKSDNYKECGQLILEHKELIEHCAWQRGTFGEMGMGTQIERFETANNKLRTISCINSNNLADVIAYYKVPEEVAKRIRFYDAMKFAESCMKAGSMNWDLGQYRKNLVYYK